MKICTPLPMAWFYEGAKLNEIELEIWRKQVTFIKDMKYEKGKL